MTQETIAKTIEPPHTAAVMNKAEQVKRLREFANQLSGTLVGDWLRDSADIVANSLAADIPPACWVDGPTEWLHRADDARRREFALERDQQRQELATRERQLAERERRLEQRADEIRRLVNHSIATLTGTAERL